MIRNNASTLSMKLKNVFRSVEKYHFHNGYRNTVFICIHFLASALDTNINCVILLTG